MAAQKTLCMLVGPKGSGKTHIGTLINQHTDIVFLRVEPIGLGLKLDADGWKKVEAVMDAMSQRQDKVMVESLGIGEGFGKFHASLREPWNKNSDKYVHMESCNNSGFLVNA